MFVANYASHSRATLNSGVLMSPVLSTQTTAEKITEIHSLFLSIPMGILSVRQCVFGPEMACYSNIFHTTEDVSERGHPHYLSKPDEQLFKISKWKQHFCWASPIKQENQKLNIENDIAFAFHKQLVYACRNRRSPDRALQDYLQHSCSLLPKLSERDSIMGPTSTSEACSYSPDLFSLQIRAGLHMYCLQHPPAWPVYWWVSDDQGRLSLEGPTHLHVLGRGKRVTLAGIRMRSYEFPLVHDSVCDMWLECVSTSGWWTLWWYWLTCPFPRSDSNPTPLGLHVSLHSPPPCPNTDSAGADWCLNPGLGGAPPGHHPSWRVLSYTACHELWSHFLFGF